jgi:gamma-glutamylcysteine synthetase
LQLHDVPCFCKARHTSHATCAPLSNQPTNQSPNRNQPINASQVIAISQGGLDRRGYDEGHFLKQLHVIVESGLAPASHLLELYSSSWGGSVDPLFKQFMY